MESFDNFTRSQIPLIMQMVGSDRMLTFDSRNFLIVTHECKSLHLYVLSLEICYQCDQLEIGMATLMFKKETLSQSVRRRQLSNYPHSNLLTTKNIKNV